MSLDCHLVIGEVAVELTHFEETLQRDVDRIRRKVREMGGLCGGALEGCLTALAERKTEVDFHFAAQTLMKRWLLLHVPLTAMVMLLVVWHILLVHIYAL